MVTCYISAPEKNVSTISKMAVLSYLATINYWTNHDDSIVTIVKEAFEKELKDCEFEWKILLNTSVRSTFDPT